MKAIIILSDTINRRYLSAYGNPQVRTPNLSRLSERSHIFDAHWTGSAPCMPARRDLMTGRLGFLERNWGRSRRSTNRCPRCFEQMAFDHIS